MDQRETLFHLSQEARYDKSAVDARCSRLSAFATGSITRVVRGDGVRVPLLKVLQSSYCRMDCRYCCNRAQRDIRRARLSPDELAREFVALADHRLVNGLFLSSGIDDRSDKASDRMLGTVELLRNRYHYHGYVHLKILPGADDSTIAQSMILANRVSLNLEAANASRMDALSRAKRFKSLVKTLERIHAIKRRTGSHVTMATQFVVGASGETDAEIMRTAFDLYRRLHLVRIFYSGFSPIRATPLEGHDPVSPWREHRLYQADTLLREYGFGYGDMPFLEDGNLSPVRDPKLEWACRHPEAFPIEVNSARPQLLLRVPGIGPVRAQRIMERRQQGHLYDIADLGLPGAGAMRAAPYLLFDGHAPTHQLSLAI